MCGLHTVILSLNNTAIFDIDGGCIKWMLCIKTVSCCCDLAIVDRDRRHLKLMCDGCIDTIGGNHQTTVLQFKCKGIVSRHSNINPCQFPYTIMTVGFNGHTSFGNNPCSFKHDSSVSHGCVISKDQSVSVYID